MWRSHYVVLGKEPSGNSLARVSDGYQLWNEAATGLFYLTAFREPLGRRPEFGQFLDRQIVHRVDVSLLERFLSDRSSTLDVKKGEVSFDLVQRTATLAKQLDAPVLAAEVTDDEYGMAVAIDNGTIKYLCFKTMTKDVKAGKSAVHVVYTTDTGFVIDDEPYREAYSVAQKAIEEVYGVAGLDLYNYCEPKPTREEAGRDAVGGNMSIKAHLESYGVFKRLAHAPPRFTLFERMLIPFRFVASTIQLPFIIAGMLVHVLIYSGNNKADAQPGMGKLTLIGMAVLAPLIGAIIWLLRLMPGY